MKTYTLGKNQYFSPWLIAPPCVRGPLADISANSWTMLRTRLRIVPHLVSPWDPDPALMWIHIWIWYWSGSSKLKLSPETKIYYDRWSLEYLTFLCEICSCKFCKLSKIELFCVWNFVIVWQNFVILRKISWFFHKIVLPYLSNNIENLVLSKFCVKFHNFWRN